VNVVGKYTLENVKELKDNIPVNENNVMELTQTYIDENELNLALNDYATKTFVLSETEPLNTSINTINSSLETKVSFESMKSYTQEYVTEQIEENNKNLNNGTLTAIDSQITDINTLLESQSLDISALQDGKLDISTFETLDQSYNDFKDNANTEHQNIYDKIDEIENNLSNEYAAINHIHDEYSLTTHTHDGFDEITLNKINNCYIGDNGNNSPERPFIPIVKSDGVMEVGKYIDFHCTVANDGDEYLDKSVRLTGFLNQLYTGNNFSCANADVKSLSVTGSIDIKPNDGSNITAASIVTNNTNNTNNLEQNGEMILYSNNNIIYGKTLISNDFETMGSITALDASGDDLSKTIISKGKITLTTDGNETNSIIEGSTISTKNLTTTNLTTASGTVSSNLTVNKLNSNNIGRVTSGYPFIPYVRSDGVMNVGQYIDFFASASNSTNNARIYINGSTLMAWSNATHFEINTTIINNAPVNESIENFQIGSPVFTTGLVYHLSEGKYVSGSLTSIDCITSVKTSGSYRQYLGICCAIHKTGDIITIGDTLKQEVEIKQDTIDFATHGDFYFRVNDSSEYSVGDIVLFDGNKLDDDLIMTAKITSSIVGKVTGIIDEHLLCVFKD
ncbi:MAG: hypothetical protein IJB21_06890, partial [Bacilli bacterium]|nr:hypothetical protein [Bacilli bacterium]